MALDELQKRKINKIIVKFCNAEKLIKMYNSWGFRKLIKFTNVDIHNRDEKGKPRI